MILLCGIYANRLRWSWEMRYYCGRGELSVLLRGIIDTDERVYAHVSPNDLGNGVYLRHIHNIINVVAHSHKEIKEQFAANLHLHLHRAAALERPPAADDQSKVMSAEAGVIVRRVLVGVPSAAQDGADLDATLQALLAQSEPFELIETVTLCCTVYGRVTEDNVSHARVKECRLDVSATTVKVFRVGIRRLDRALEQPSVPAFIVDKPGIVVALVQILEDTGEDFGFFVWQIDATRVRLEELASQRRREERRVVQYVFVCCEQSLVWSNHECDYGAGEVR